MLQTVLTLALENEDRMLIRNSLGDLIMLYVEQQEIEKADSLYKELLCFVDEDFGSSSYMVALTKMYLSIGNLAQAEYCLDKGWKRATNQVDSIALYVVSAELYSLQGQQERAYHELQKGMELQNQEARQALQQPVLTAQRDYLSEKLEFEAYKLRMRKLLNLVSTLFFLLLLVVLVYVFVRIFKKHKKESQQVINYLENEKHKVEEEKSSIASVLQQLDKDKRNADQTIATLKEEIDKKRKENNAKVLELNTKLQLEQQSVEALKQALARRKEKSDAEISALLEKMEQERMVAKQMIQTQNDVIAQKEESRQTMKSLILQLENDSRVNAESMALLRSELEIQEKEHRLYIQKAETGTKALRDENRKMVFQKVELLKNVLEQVVEIVLLHERKYLKEETKIRRIKEGIQSLKMDYYAGDNEYKKVEALVNRYLDNVMEHFRKEICLANESEYRRVCYMFAGVSGQVIGEIMNESKDAVYQRKSRMLKKIGSLSCIHKELFVLLLSK